MFRKTIIPLVFVTIALVLVFGCSKSDNPFDPNKSGYNETVQENISFIAATTPAPNGQIQDADPGTSEIEGEIDIWFQDYMNASTVTTSNIVIRDTTNGGAIQGASLTYYPEIKKAVFRGTFSNDAVFIVTVKSDLENQAGVKFDGNGNGSFDGSPYDDYRYKFYTGTGNVGDYDFVHPEINGFTPGISNGVNVLPVIIVQFTGADVDTTTLTLSNFHLVKASSQVAVSCSLLLSTHSQIIFMPKDTIDQATEYAVTVNCANVEDTCGNVLLGLQDDNEGWVANIGDYSWDFITDITDTLHDGTPPSVSSANAGTVELVVRFNDDMDLSTFTTSNIRVYNNSTGQNLVGSIMNEYDGRGFRYTLENAQSGTTYRLWVSKDVKEAAPGNWNLDSNGNGVGGEWDDDYTTTF